MFTFDVLKEKDPSLTFEAVDINGEPGAVFPAARMLEVAKRLRDEFGFTQLIDAFGIDRMERHGRFEITYTIRNHVSKERAFIKVRCEERTPHVPSLVEVWTGANWNEREAFDMFGVVFDGHPDLRRMYLPEEFEHHPLRKDFPLTGIPGSIPLPHHEDADPRFNVNDQSPTHGVHKAG